MHARMHARTGRDRKCDCALMQGYYYVLDCADFVPAPCFYLMPNSLAADRAAVLAAHKRLMIGNHPDRGTSGPQSVVMRVCMVLRPT
jgi:hypothetical protein